MLSDMVKPVARGRNGRTILLNGRTGSGKTTAARFLLKGSEEPGAPPPMKVLLAGTERKLTSLEDVLGLPNLSVVTIEDFDYPDPREPKTFEEALASPKANLYKIIYGLVTEQHDYDVLFVDSIMRWCTHLLWQIAITNTNPDARSDYALFKHKATKFFDSIATVTDSTVVKKPVHVIATCGIESEADMLDGGKKKQAAIDGTKVAPLIGHYFDDVLMMDTEVGEGGMTKYVAYTQSNPNFDAKVSGWAKLPPKIESPNLFNIIGVLKGDRVDGKWVKK